MSPSQNPDDTPEPGADGPTDDAGQPSAEGAAPDPDRAVGDFGDGEQSDAGGDSDVDGDDGDRDAPTER